MQECISCLMENIIPANIDITLEQKQYFKRFVTHQSDPRELCDRQSLSFQYKL